MMHLNRFKKIKMDRIPVVHGFASTKKSELARMADGLLLKQPWAIEFCVRFISAETRGFWHNRARSLMSRRLKHCPLDPNQSDQLVVCITKRLFTGLFFEQFKDQLRLALYLDKTLLLQAAHASLSHSKTYVRRYAEWVILSVSGNSTQTH